VADELVRNPDAALPSLRWVVSTGEELRPSLAGRILDSLPNVRLLNAYGFTETSDDVAHHEVRAEDLTSARLPVGSPVPNSALYVLVEAGGSWRSARPGEPGELFVGGLPVGRGYLGDRAATTAAYFRDVLDPDSPTGRLYRTGDAAMLRDGLLYCLGRLDRQTKISGVRVEPDEIEATLLRHPAVARCAVFVRRNGIETSVVACYVPADPTVRAETLRAHLAARLPAVMVPDVWLPLDEFPLSTNGKVDYHALEGLA
jgi:acyl-coenzyme A synthetase/AMP-(fatty) acid ligase